MLWRGESGGPIGMLSVDQVKPPNAIAAFLDAINNVVCFAQLDGMTYPLLSTPVVPGQSFGLHIDPRLKRAKPTLLGFNVHGRLGPIGMS